MAHISALFDPATGPGPALSPVNEEARDRRALARSALASLVFDGASAVEITNGQRRLTVRRIQNHPTPVLVDATFPRADGGLVTAALTATDIDDLPLPRGHRWRRAEDESLLSMLHQ